MATILQNELVNQVVHPYAPRVTIIVPVFNEQATVALALESVFDEETPKEIILVDDGSSDGSAEAVQDWIDKIPSLNATTARFVWLKHLKNRGKGAAIRTALTLARGEFVIIQDADLEVRTNCYSALLAPLMTGTAEFVMGCRSRSLTSKRSFHAIGVTVLDSIVRYLYGYNIQDSACCFKVLSLENLRRMNLEAEKFEICPEIIAKASKLGLRLQQVDVDYFPRTAHEGKKLRLLKDGLAAIQTLLRYRRWQESFNTCNSQKILNDLPALQIDVPKSIPR